MCCETVLGVPPAVRSFQCAVCQTVNDLDPLPPPAPPPPDRGPAALRPLLAAAPADPAAAARLAEAAAAAFASLDSVLELAGVPPAPAPIDDAAAAAAVAAASSAFAALATHPDAVAAAAAAAARLLRRPGRHIASEREALALHVLMELASVLSAKDRFESLLRIFGLSAALGHRIQKALVRWTSSLPAASFERRVELVGQFVTNRLATNPELMEAYDRDWGIRAAARASALLFTANMPRVPRLPHSSFYNTMVDMVDIVADFDRWQRQGNRQLFSFCQYAFMISLGSKMTILQADAETQMRQRFQEAIVRMAFHGVRTDPFLILSIRRAYLIQDSLNQLQSKILDLKKKLVIQFVGEEGVDAGGLTKEWFLLLVRQLFDPLYGMFIFDDDSRLCWFNVSSLEHETQYQLVGIVVGLSIYNNTILDVQLPLACFKKLLGYPVGLEDLKVLQPSLARGLQQLLDYTGDDVEDVFCRTFVAEYEAFGEIVQEPLIPDGATVPVTSQNKQDYVTRLVDWILNKSVAKQFEAFRAGFFQVCGGNALSIFLPEEIELMVRGSAQFDLQGLRLTAELDGFEPNEPVIEWFWQILDAFDAEMQRSFLSFVTGTDRIPATGTETLRIKVSCLGPDSEALPIAHTCFNQICIHRYSSKDKLERKLRQATQWSTGFLVK
ncbi:putative E3 ubiquitin-protein ligase [Polyrhizophydium stewartii]|uniref:HECT-type E3 ubiquitin transferase n=1 Tax=Polyrhizophydium stewartii TaxID=2732419 RepID=A0ABR4N0I1_9FUNG